MKDRVRHSRDDALESDEVEKLLASCTGRNHFIISALTYGGIREGELVHMKKHWVHIEDKKADKFGFDFIQVPRIGDECRCVDCLRQAFYEHERAKVNKKAGIEDDTKNMKLPSTWYMEKQKEFYRLKRNDALPDMGKINWMPKTEAGARKIPILFDEFRNATLLFFETEDGLNVSRQAIWQVVKKVGKDAFGERIVYPHCIRATCSNMWADSGIDPKSLTNIMGWGDMRSAQPYLKRREDRKVFNDLKNHKDKFMK